MSLFSHTALELWALIRAGEVCPAEVAEVALSRSKALQPALNPFITLVEAAPVPADRGRDCPQWGVPMAVMDNLSTKGIRTTCASQMLAEYVPPYDATVVERLQNSGAVCLGKLNMDEFAMGTTSETSCFGPVKNPWAIERASGVASGGAAAVAARCIWYGVGSDTGGSLRQSAAHCGVTGMRPTYGTVSRYGLVAHGSSLDQAGPVARTAADCAAVLDLIRGRDERDGTTLELDAGGLLAGLTGDVRGLRIGLPEECFGGALAPAVARAVRAAAEVLRDRGAIVEWLSLPALGTALPTYYILACAEASSNLARYAGVGFGLSAPGATAEALCCNSRTLGFGPEVKRRILRGTLLLGGNGGDYYRRALQARAKLCHAFDQVFAQVDLLLSPTTPTVAPLLGAADDPWTAYGGDVYTVPASLGGLPALSMPCGWEEGMPVGAQLIGPRLGDGAVLNAAHAFQMETDFHQKTPGGGLL